MRATVLRDGRLLRQAGRFVWLSIDTEDSRNAAFLERFPVEVWPTFLVVEPRQERPLRRWLGAATVRQLEELLSGARRPSGDRAAAALAEADRAHAAGRSDEAAAGYRRALASAARDWPRRARAVESLVTAEQAAGHDEACAAAARREGPQLPRGVSFARVAAGGLACALAAPRDAPWRAASVAALEPLATEAVQLPDLLADDRSELYGGIVEAREDRGEQVEARRVAERWWGFLEAEARRAPSPEARAALDPARVSAALALGDPGRALPALAASERELPRDYNPPARRAYLLREMGRLGEARAAAEEALRKAYGPRKLRVYDLLGGILERQGDRAALAATLDAALAYGEELPAPQRNERLVASLRARRAALGAARP